MYRCRWGKCDGISVHDAEICSCRFDLVSDCREEVTQCRYTDPNMGFANPITQLCEAGTIAVSAKNFSLFRSAFAGRAAGVCCSFGCLDRLDFCRFAAMLIMLAHAWFQLKHAKSGLPPEATDETQIATWQSASPDKSAACSAGEFELQSGETVRSVSIGYDVTSRWGEVEVLLDRHLAFADAEAQGDRLVRMLCLEKDGRGIVWEDPETGQRQVLDFGVPTPGLASFLAISIYVPYAEYVTSFLEEAGKFPQGFMMGLLGFLIGLTWWAMCMMIGTCVNVAGFQTIEDENLFIFITFTIFCVAASAFNVYLTWYYTQDLWQHHTSSWFQRVKGFLLDTGGPVTTLRDLRKEIDFGFRVFQVLVPGVLFTPCLLSPLNNFLIPYFRESALLLLFGQGKSGREAERFLEPLPIGLAWDYQGHVTLPCCCCLTLFIMSPSMWWTQAYLCIWAFFFYFFQRFMHLRVCKKMYCTSNKLDSMVLYFGWGLLLAELAACHAYWRVRLQEWQWISILKAVALSYAVYWSLLWALGVPWPLRFRGELDRLERTRERSDDRCQSCEDFCYNWLNVNPVYVLKSQYCADEFGLDPCVFYEPGKEYLQLAPGDGDLHAAQSQRWKKASAGLWLEFEGLGCIAPICFDEVCTDVASPTRSDSRNRLLRTSDHDLSFGEADPTPFLHENAKDSPSASAALASVPGDQDPMDVSDFMEPSPRNAAKPSTSSADKREGPPDVFDAPERSAPDAARDQPDAKREAPSDAFDPQQLSARAASASEPPAVQHEAPETASQGLEQSPCDAAAPSEPTPVQHEAPENASQGLEQSCLVAKSGISIVRGDGPRDAAAPSVPTPVQHEAGPCDAAAPSEPTPVQHEAPENASQGLEQSCLVAKSGISIVRGDGTAWVGGDNPEGSYVEGPRDAAAPSEPTPVQHEAGPCDAAAPSEPTPVQREEYIVATHRKRKSSDGPLFVQRRSQPKKATRAPEVGELVKAQRAMRAMTAQEEEDAFRDILEWEANVKGPPSHEQQCDMASWLQENIYDLESLRFMDAAAQGGGTPAGTAKVITNGLMATGPVFQECGEWPEGVMPAG
ncbi:ttn-1, partial [Symbiodinium sp. KB8]